MAVTELIQPGLWLVASHKLSRPAPTREPYPHICGAVCTCHPEQWPIRRRDCAACAIEQKAA